MSLQLGGKKHLQPLVIKMQNDGLPGDDMRPEGATPPASLTSRTGTRNLGPGCDGAYTTAHPGSFPWTPENTQRLIELAATKTIPEIVQIMGASKNSIVGRAHRLGISFPTFRFECAKVHREIARMTAAGLGVTDIARTLGQPISTVNGKLRYLRRRDEPKKTIWTLADLGPDQCRWPLGNPKDRAEEFCGEPTAKDKPYCKTHHARAHLKLFHIERKRRETRT